jgi:hypothetical protein
VGGLPAFGTVGEWQVRGRVAAWERHGMCKLAFNVAGEQHGMCESALTVCDQGSVNEAECYSIITEVQ